MACVTSHGTCNEVLVDTRGDVDVGGDDSLWEIEDAGIWKFDEVESVREGCREFGGDICGEDICGDKDVDVVGNICGGDFSGDKVGDKV
ncbi:hypothetical protein FCV25MIE_30291 [Fagus crenata]